MADSEDLRVRETPIVARLNAILERPVIWVKRLTDGKPKHQNRIQAIVNEAVSLTTMVYAVEAWTVSGDEKPCEEVMEQAEEFQRQPEAMRWAWDRMEEGFAVRMYRR